MRRIEGLTVGEVPEGRKKPTLKYWIKDGEENACEGFGKTVIFTDNAEGVDAQIFESLTMRYRMPFCRYLAGRCKHLRISLKRLVEELEGIRVALVKDKTGRGCELMVEADEVVLAPGSGAIYGRFQDRHLAD